MAAAPVWTPLATQAVEPFKRPGQARLALSLAAYSLRQYFDHKDPAKRITMLDFIDYCADHGCAGAEVTSYYFPKALTEDFFLQVRRRAYLRGVALSGTAVGNNFVLAKGPKRDEQIAMVKKWVDHSAVMGLSHIRVFAGPTGSMPKDDAISCCIEALEECGEYAGRKGVFLGLENHGGIVADPDDLLGIIKAVKCPWVGINLDSGNFQTDDPYADLARCVPYAVNVQIKVEITPRGKSKQWSDIPRLVKMLRDGNYQGYVALEYEAAEDPFTAVPRFLKAIQDALAA